MSKSDERKDTQHTGPARGAYEDAQKQVRERNDAARQAAKQQRADDERRTASGQRERDEQAGVYR